MSIVRDGAVLAETPDSDYTLSAAALHLLRTLSSDHNRTTRVGEHLVPHCGHTMWPQEGSKDVSIMGCNLGVDWEVNRRADAVVLVFDDRVTVTVPFADWRSAVLAFSDRVEEFYARSVAKRLPSDPYDGEGFERFMSEWRRRRQGAELNGPGHR
jgi:hypothetical protein